MTNYTSLSSDSLAWTWNEELNGWETSAITETSFNNVTEDEVPYLSVQYVEYVKYRFDNVNHKKLCPGTYTFNSTNGNIVINFNSYDLLKFKYYQDPSTATLTIITKYNSKFTAQAPSVSPAGQRIVKITNRSYNNTHFQIIKEDVYAIPVITFKNNPIFEVSMTLASNERIIILNDGPIDADIYITSSSGGGGGDDPGEQDPLLIEAASSDTDSLDIE